MFRDPDQTADNPCDQGSELFATNNVEIQTINLKTMLEAQHGSWDSGNIFTLSTLDIRANEVIFLMYTLYLPVDIVRTSDNKVCTLLFKIDHTTDPYDIKLVHADDQMAQVVAFELTGFVYTLAGSFGYKL